MQFHHQFRITRRMLDGGVKADVIVQLNRNRLSGTIGG